MCKYENPLDYKSRSIENDLGQFLEFEHGRIWIYGSDGFFGDFLVNYCPICGEKV